jgi:Myb-like DNA-binding domain
MLHWRLILNPNQPVRGIGSWSSEEDSRLHALVAAHGAKWSLVARRLVAYILRWMIHLALLYKFDSCSEMTV